LLLPDLINENKIIYLDCDIIVRDDCNASFLTDLENQPIAGTSG
jgi:lipopolysaccharide biosynthesis glycosyltransferase